MNIIYISALSSKRLVNLLYEQTGLNPGFAVQKFSRLLTSGLIENGQSVLALSNPPITRSNSKSIFPNIKSEVEDKIKYKYIPFLNIPFIKHVCVFIYTFFYILFWGLRNRKDKSVICDTLSISASLAALLATKINRVKCCGVFTDIYGLMVGMNTKSYIRQLAAKLNNRYSSLFTHYILLTEQMNEVVNRHGRPRIVMEALCDYSTIHEPKDNEEKEFPRTILYAGGINEVYGLKMLAEGFLKANIKDAKLVYYGHGPYVEEFKKLCEEHTNLEYRGIASNDIIVSAEHRATLLVNPRFSTEEFTKFSFPSKNMEYMVSGTPLLTTRLPGMPLEYNDYVYLFEEETLDGYAETIKAIMEIDIHELQLKGNKAKQFVLNEKNNVKQASRIIELLEG